MFRSRFHIIGNVWKRTYTLTSRVNFNNFQELGSDALPSRSYINSLFCQQIDIDWLNLYPTLPSQEIANIVNDESARLLKLISGDDSIKDGLSVISNSIILDIGIPGEFGGDPGPAGSASIIQVALAEGLGNNLNLSKVFAHHSAAIDFILKYGSQNQRQIISMDAIAGFMTSFSSTQSLKAHNEMVTGNIEIVGAALNNISNVLLKILDGEEEYFIIVNKKQKGITVEEKNDQLQTGFITFENLAISEEMKIPVNTDINEFQAQMQYLEDSYNIIISASILGSLKRLYNITAEMLSKKTFGSKKIIKSDLGKVFMSKLQKYIFRFESAIYAVAGKRPWSSEFLTAEIMAIRILANNSGNYLEELETFLGHQALSNPFYSSKKQIRKLAREYPNHQCYSTIGLRGFQSHLYQQCGIAKRLHGVFPPSREWRRLQFWNWNWKSRDPELVSFGWSSIPTSFLRPISWGMDSKKIRSATRKINQQVKENLRTRTKKDGVGTWAPVDHEPTKRVKYNLEFAVRDFAHAVCKHGNMYGTEIPRHQWLVHDFGKIAAELFYWSVIFSRQEKTHQTSIRGFESERDLAYAAMNENFENIVFDMNYTSSTWYFDSFAPEGRQRAIDEFILGEKLINSFSIK